MPRERNSADALAFSEQVTSYLRAKLPENNIKSWLQIGGVFATIHWTMEFRDMTHFEEVLGIVMLDEQYQTMVAQASDCWLPGSVKDTLLTGL